MGLIYIEIYSLICMKMSSLRDGLTYFSSSFLQPLVRELVSFVASLLPLSPELPVFRRACRSSPVLKLYSHC